MWHNIVSLAAELCRLPEMHFLAPGRKDFRFFLKEHVGDLSNDANLDRMVDLIFDDKAVSGIAYPFWRFEFLDVEQRQQAKTRLLERLKESDRSLKAIFQSLIETMTFVTGKTNCCVKFPVHVKHVPDLLEWYPDCKVVHIIRDPRAIAMSKTNDPGGTAHLIRKWGFLRYPIQKGMMTWVSFQYVWCSRLHTHYKKLPNYSLFVYEDLLANPKEVLPKLFDFIGVDVDRDSLDPATGVHEHQKSSLTGKRRKAIDPTAASNWKKVIGPIEKALITFFTRSGMKRFGYDPDSHPVFTMAEPQEGSETVRT